MCTYNTGSNDAFLVRYGFVERSNPNDVFETSALLQRIRAAELIPHSRFQRLRDLGFEEALLEVSTLQCNVHCLARQVLVTGANTVFADLEVRTLSSQLLQTPTQGGCSQCDATQAGIFRTGVEDSVLAAVRLLLAPPESVGPNATASRFEQPGDSQEERRVRQVGQCMTCLCAPLRRPCTLDCSTSHDHLRHVRVTQPS